MSFLGMFTSKRELLPEPSTRGLYIMFSMFMLVHCFCCLFRPHLLNHYISRFRSFWIFYQCVTLGPGSTFILVKVKLNCDSFLSPY